ncbi:MAG: DUF2793 domain-containing protein [Rhizobiaceae bacterium]|nr:DUF2793 domain-containing protein [Rhizobiaceae bacterium]
MEETSNLNLPYIMPSQAQKHVTHNEALRKLDALVQLAVVSRNLATPPASPAEGTRYIVANSASGEWAGQEGNIAAWQDGAWIFYEPRAGWLAPILDEGIICFWTGIEWQKMQGGSIGEELDAVSLQNAPMLGVGMTADAVNNLAVKLNNALWTAKTGAEGGTGDLRYKMNKEAETCTVSLLMQSGYAGAAEMGLMGSNDFALKVSGDGSNWREAISVDRSTGAVRFPATNVLTDYCLNLYSDSGRFAVDNLGAISVGPFTMPAYLTRYNSATVAGVGKFIQNNTDYGGTAGTMNASVRALVDMIRGEAYRRYGVEFWVAELTSGSGTGSPVNHLSQNWYLSLISSQVLRAPNMTLHLYLRAMNDQILVRCNTGQTLILNGVASRNHVVILPSSNWVSLTIHDSVPYRQSFGYSPMALSIHARTANVRYQIACPALMPGIVPVDDNVGPVGAYNIWAA